MSTFKKCPFHRDSENPATGSGLGDCDVLGEQVICEGDIQSCDKPDVLREQLQQEKYEILENRGEEGQKKKSSKYRVLVVDDEELLRNVVVAYLSGQGHQCETASNGAEALNKIRQDKFDGVIADIVMPEMNGIVLTRELLSLYPNVPVLIMTGQGEEYPTELAIGAGARDFIGKPFSYDQFTLRFNKMMSDHEVSLEIESKQNEKISQIQRESSQTTNELQREIESLKSKLNTGYRFNPWM